MSDLTLEGDPPIGVKLRRSRRARRMSLRLSGIDGRVTLTVPPSVADREAASFARSKEDWLRRHLARAATPETVGHGTVLPIEGRPVRLSLSPGAHVSIGRDGFTAASATAAVAALRALARDRLVAAVDRHAARLGRKPSSIVLRDTRSRWGSCSSEGRLMFSWRLILAPPPVLDYVAAHEVAHLARMDHSPAFWATVETLAGDYRGARGWLRRQGAGLHRWRFDD